MIIKSRYCTIPQTWDDRIAAMRKDLERKEYAYLHFKVALNMNDAKDNADYERYTLFRQMAYWVAKQHAPAVEKLLDQLEEL